MALSQFEQDMADGVDEIITSFGDIEHTFVVSNTSTSYDPSDGTLDSADEVKYIEKGSPSVDYEIKSDGKTPNTTSTRVIYTRGNIKFDPLKVVKILESSVGLWSVTGFKIYGTGNNIAAYEFHLTR